MAVILVNQPDERMISTGIRSFEELVFQLYQKSSLSPSSSFVQQYGEEILVSDYRKRIRDVVLSAITDFQFLNTVNSDLLSRYQDILSFFKNYM